MVGRGLPVTAFNILSELRQIACFDLGGIPSRYPYLLMLPQNEVEEILHDRLAAQGHTVGYGTEVMTFTQDRDGVRVQLRDQQGRPQDTTVALAGGLRRRAQPRPLPARGRLRGRSLRAAPSSGAGWVSCCLSPLGCGCGTAGAAFGPRPPTASR
jgi:hypothetical protein